MNGWSDGWMDVHTKSLQMVWMNVRGLVGWPFGELKQKVHISKWMNNVLDAATGYFTPYALYQSSIQHSVGHSAIIHFIHQFVLKNKPLKIMGNSLVPTSLNRIHTYMYIAHTDDCYKNVFLLF